MDNANDINVDANDVLNAQLKSMAEAHNPDLPSANAIWWCAQIAAKQRQKERVERPLLVMQFVSAFVCAVVFLAFLTQDKLQINKVLSYFSTPVMSSYAWPVIVLMVMMVVVYYFFFPQDLQARKR